MTTMIKIHSHNSIAWLQYSKLYCHIRLCTGMWLNICIIASKKFLCTLNCKIFYHIHTLTSTIIALCWISFRIFVC